MKFVEGIREHESWWEEKIWQEREGRGEEVVARTRRGVRKTEAGKGSLEGIQFGQSNEKG